MHPSRIYVSLSHYVDSLWKQCHELTHEMSMTPIGRRIFPSLQYTIQGMHPEKMYSLSMHLEFADDKKLKFTKENGYVETVCELKLDPPRRVWHRMGSQPGSLWMSHDISFDFIRITNRRQCEQRGSEYIFLHAQRRYLPVLTIYETGIPILEVKIPYTTFITVTNYHIPELVSLKIKNNPFSSAVRNQHQLSGTPIAYSKRWRVQKKAGTIPQKPNNAIPTSNASKVIPNASIPQILPDLSTIDFSNFPLFLSLLSQIDFSQQLSNPIPQLSCLPTPALTPFSIPSVSPEISPEATDFMLDSKEVREKLDQF